eukprot:CAMPEP_0179098588 /NCGR_PEP_ID=MMETSP0796-20121207/45441_1 /TAXON_ID=73915 /ORGANISM="Pyrodinium bahamense, Strain pbaha01" /LENGTH=371 /DNA_ID=CAMNT_0020796371 /DNA_START=14 /DNA_END=1127 /DNA_ORIENTATION=+
MMFVQLELKGYKLSDALEGGTRYDEKSDGTFVVFNTLADIFNAIGAVPPALRVPVHVPELSREILDSIIVVITVFDAYVLSRFGEGVQDLAFVRMLRFLRLGRALRMIRTMSIFRQLRVLLNTIAISYGSLFWSMLILLIFMLMSSLLLCQLSQEFISDASVADMETRQWMSEHYGTAVRSLYTVFEVTFSGCWPNYARTPIFKVNLVYGVFFAIYVTAIVFAMVRIISALFLRDTLQTAARDADILIHEKQAETKVMQNNLKQLFKEADETGDGYLSRQELQQIMSIEKVRIWMGTLGIDTHDMDSLFYALDDGDDQIAQEEFLQGIMRLKNSVRSQDLLRIERFCKKLVKQHEALHKEVSQLKRPMRQE